MSSSPDTLLFRFPAHTDSILSKINRLREEQHFCDITLLLSGPPGATAQARYFHGHRVVLAASSDFLRDQFLLHEGQAELSVGVFSSVEVGWRLLLSCYTGLLKVPLRELVSYLTAASMLQMTQVVEKCAQAISTYLDPTLAFLKLDGHSEREKEIQQVNSSQSGTYFKIKEERDAAQSSTDNQEASTEECGAAVIQFKLRVSQGNKAESEELCEVRDDKRVIVDNTERCDRVFQHLESYVGHLKEHRQYLCLVCRKVFSQKSNLTRHIQVHTGVKPFRCPLCHKTFSQKATLQDHFNLHTGSKPLKCHCCGAHFVHKLDLRRHLKGIHGKCSLQNKLEAVD
ncbi:zinc finger and BTB domain-containing protein 26-like [Tautogolabrus adspersus]